MLEYRNILRNLGRAAHVKHDLNHPKLSKLALQSYLKRDYSCHLNRSSLPDLSFFIVGDRINTLAFRSLLIIICCHLLMDRGVAQGLPSLPDEILSNPKNEIISQAPIKVDVQPAAHDQEIARRLLSVLEATSWFTEPKVRVQDGVVFLQGKVDSIELKKWASELARNTQDVVAVANDMLVVARPIWDFAPAWKSLSTLWGEFTRSLPLIAFGCFILFLSLGVGMAANHGARVFLRNRIQAKLLQRVLGMGTGALVFLIGIYIVLRISGLSQLAFTVIGGTGLAGLALGIAFRDITENFLASIFLSIHRPFKTGDLVEISSITGYVRQLNIRTTILMNVDGNLVQIPNATVYKSIICNFTANPNRRDSFIVGIGYDDSIPEAQRIARKVLSGHLAVLKDPEPWVLVDDMGRATINLRIYFWLNGHEHSFLKVRSSVIRLLKHAFQEAGISMPDEAREVIFPRGIPVTLLDSGLKDRQPALPTRKQYAVARQELPNISTEAENGLGSDAKTIEEQAQQVKPLNDDENLLKDTPPSPASLQQTADSRQ